MSESHLPQPTRKDASSEAAGQRQSRGRRSLLLAASALAGSLFAVAGCGDAFKSGDDASSGGVAGSIGEGFGGIGAGGQNVAGSGSGSGGGGGVNVGAGGAAAASGGSTVAAGGASGAGGMPEGGSCSASESPAVAACTVIESLGIFVSPTGSDLTGSGTREAPFQTLANAISEARKQSKRVYACSSAGPFEETVVLDATFDGTELYGGFDCDSWAYSGSVPTAVVSQTSRALVASNLTSLVIEDFSFTSANASEPGESSAAAWIANSKGVVLRRLLLTAGEGARGLEGAGTHDPAPKGADGNVGVDACQALHAPNLGGASVETLCDEEPTGSIGGRGGDAGTDDASGSNASPGKPSSGGLGQAGRGQVEDIIGWNCAVGGNFGGGQMGKDAPAQPGAAGALTSANDQGALTATSFVGVAGGDGANGAPGQGGGGGGGAMAPLTCGSVLPRTGASGGSGGGGGCGGKGGKGGGAGGGSFALVSFHSNITLEGGVLTAQSAGRGGNGGFGQPGGAGGLGGANGKGSSGSKDACSGASGGKGGDGGHGGGGAGGPSAAIAYAGWAPTKIGTLLKAAKAPANGGSDGAGANNGSGAGSAGSVSDVLAFSG